MAIDSILSYVDFLGLVSLNVFTLALLYVPVILHLLEQIWHLAVMCEDK